MSGTAAPLNEVLQVICGQGGGAGAGVDVVAVNEDVNATFAGPDGGDAVAQGSREIDLVVVGQTQPADR
ncbi:hypothetical protein AB0B67_46685 [Streptomyces spectabilis]|uniref:Uncharacterized protein n=1 Tax=Streptomyces spectabilis TaxID=68270 RepID=A0A7W8B421_STRST|nr:hypothetical protein [Streptomyces spectabilis]MBB5109938.1 hypothetical protein [Streptomyces spectabilis]